MADLLAGTNLLSVRDIPLFRVIKQNGSTKDDRRGMYFALALLTVHMCFLKEILKLAHRWWICVMSTLLSFISNTRDLNTLIMLYMHLSSQWWKRYVLTWQAISFLLHWVLPDAIKLRSPLNLELVEDTTAGDTGFLADLIAGPQIEVFPIGILADKI